MYDESNLNKYLEYSLFLHHHQLSSSADHPLSKLRLSSSVRYQLTSPKSYFSIMKITSLSPLLLATATLTFALPSDIFVTAARTTPIPFSTNTPLTSTVHCNTDSDCSSDWSWCSNNGCASKQCRTAADCEPHQLCDQEYFTCQDSVQESRGLNQTRIFTHNVFKRSK